MKHIQARLSEEDFKKYKKKAVDLGITLEEFIKQSLEEKFLREEEDK